MYLLSISEIKPTTTDCFAKPSETQNQQQGAFHFQEISAEPANNRVH
jgi:hypothetical protein